MSDIGRNANYGPGAGSGPAARPPSTGPTPAYGPGAVGGPDDGPGFGPGPGTASRAPAYGPGSRGPGVRADRPPGGGSATGGGPDPIVRDDDHGSGDGAGGGGRGRRTLGPGAKKAGFAAGAIALVGCVAGAVQALTGIIDTLDKPLPPPDTSVVVNAPGPPPPQDATIDLTYSGTTSGCEFGVVVNIGGAQAQLSGTRYTMRHVPLGRQAYTAVGVIDCGPAGACQVAADDFVEIADGRSYAVRWAIADTGLCSLRIDNT